MCTNILVHDLTIFGGKVVKTEVHKENRYVRGLRTKGLDKKVDLDSKNNYLTRYLGGNLL